MDVDLEDIPDDGRAPWRYRKKTKPCVLDSVLEVSIPADPAPTQALEPASEEASASGEAYESEQPTASEPAPVSESALAPENILLQNKLLIQNKLLP